MKKLFLKTLDKRNKGFKNWKYYVLIHSSYNRPEKVLFCNMREWCWTNWGPSKELNSYDSNDLFDGVNCSNPRWCWQNDQFTTRIYLKGDAESIAFTLKWF